MKFVLNIFFLIQSLPALATLNVITTTTDLAWLVKSIGQSRVSVSSLLDGSEDPHYVDAMPSWIARVSNADVFCFVGLELEVGWAPKVLQRASNKKVLSGGKGHCDVGKSIQALEVVNGKLDRSMGDVHASGNPHYHLGPEQFKKAANGVFELLVVNDPNGANEYNKNLKQTLSKIDHVKQRVNDLFKNHSGLKMMSYHKEFSYFVKDFGLQYMGDLEELPGVPPSAGRIARVALEAKNNKVDVVLASTAHSKKLLKKFQEISGVPFRQVAISIRPKGQPSDYEELMLGIAKALVGKK